MYLESGSISEQNKQASSSDKHFTTDEIKRILQKCTVAVSHFMTTENHFIVLHIGETKKLVESWIVSVTSLFLQGTRWIASNTKTFVIFDPFHSADSIHLKLRYSTSEL